MTRKRDEVPELLTKLKGEHTEHQAVTFPHRTVRSHEHRVIDPGGYEGETVLVKCDGTEVRDER